MTAHKPCRSALHSDVSPSELWAWAMFDFVNSGYTTVVITALFNAYFVAVVAGNAPWATFAWTAAPALSYLLIVLSAPLLGAFADLHAAKKKLLAMTTAGCVLFTALLYFAQPGALPFAIACIVASNFFFGSGENLIAAFLPEIARTGALGRVSGWGWGLGYLGGLVTLAICLAYVAWAEAQGQTAAQFVPVTMLITAGMFALASLPTFMLLRERARPGRGSGGPCAICGNSPTDLRRFLVCILFYQAGIQAVITLVAIYAHQAMGSGTQQTLLVLVVNITAAGGARAGAVLDGGEYHQLMYGRLAVRRSPSAALPHGGILRAIGAGGKTGVGGRAAHLRRGDLADRRRSPARAPPHRQLFRRRPDPAYRRAASTRPAGRPPGAPGSSV